MIPIRMRPINPLTDKPDSDISPNKSIYFLLARRDKCFLYAWSALPLRTVIMLTVLRQVENTQCGAFLRLLDNNFIQLNVQKIRKGRHIK